MNVLSLEQIRRAVLDALGRHLRLLGVKMDEVNSNFDLIGSGLLDSVSFVELLMHIEQALGNPIELAELDFTTLTTVDGLVAQLYRQQTFGSDDDLAGS
jgi:acyl carrier protein